jgi:hypothetical protein
MEESVKQKRVLQTIVGVSTHNISAMKSEEGLLTCCKIGAKSEGYNRPVLLVTQIYQKPTLGSSVSHCQ